MDIDFSQVVKAVLDLLIVIIGVVVIPWIASKNTAIAALLAKVIIPMLVFGAEKWLYGKTGDEKREWVLTLWGKLHITVDSDIVRAFLESACEDLDFIQGKALLRLGEGSDSEDTK